MEITRHLRLLRLDDAWTSRARVGLPLVLVFLLSLPAVTTRLYAADEIQYFAYLRSLWFDQDLSFENEYQHFYDRGIAHAYGFHETFLELRTATGLRYNFGTIGSAILWAPFYAVGDLTARGMSLAGSDIAVDGFSQPYLSAVTYASAVYGFLAIAIAMTIAGRLVGRGIAAGLVIWAGTPLLFYMYIAPGMAHACSAFTVAAFVGVWLQVRRAWSFQGIMALGAVTALMAMVREQDLLLAIGPIADFTWTAITKMRVSGDRVGAARHWVAVASAGTCVFGLCYAPQAMSYLALNGRFGPPEVITGKMNWLALYAPQVLFSPEHGLFVWTPLLLVAAGGLLRMAWPARARSADGVVTRRIGLLLCLMAATQIYVTGSVESWTSAGAFGQRRFVGLTILWVVGLAAALQAVRGIGVRRAFWAACALSVWWNLGLMAQFGAGTMDRQRLELGKNVYNTFVVFPRQLPQLAYRYLFDRESFYAAPRR
ncbi:MAG: hypothetical protein QF463_00520 [Vicinamibacterales bacterium]|jgi:hypothetical protein|nr:hypothetical protein [Vicinamibacterales bacterium]|tara:strand:+ start:10994 stop:12445 length:1452 start_codon:yes stop_codon:yes gene_type:complete